MMNNDYFPLGAGLLREYGCKSAGGSGIIRIEVLRVTVAGGAATAQCRRVARLNGEPEKNEDFMVVRDAEAVRSGERIEFVLPARVGAKWESRPNQYGIEALDAEVRTPAGLFKGCMKVGYLIAGGDGGSGERYYAPGIGLVKVDHHDEADPFTWELLKASGGATT